MKKGCGFKFAAFMLALMLVLSMSFSALAAETPVLVVTGTEIVSGAAAADLTAAVANEKSYTLDELKALGVTKEVIYSAINSYANTTVYKGEGADVKALLALCGYTANGTVAAVAGDGYEAVVDLSAVRYYYPAFVSGDVAGAAEVPSILAWASAGKKGKTDIPAAVEVNEDGLLFMAGQLNITDQNNPLYNKGVVKLLAGEELPAVLAVDGTAYTRAEVLLMPRTEKVYTYTNSGGEASDKVRGVLLADLLGTAVADTAVLSFTCADGYDVSSYDITYAEAKANSYMLAYEKEADGAFAAVYDKAKKGDARGYFVLYGEGIKPCKMTDSITTKAGEAAPATDVPTTTAPEAPVVTPPVVAPVDNADPVAFVTEKGIMVGTDNGFAPAVDASRATAVAVLARVSGEVVAGNYSSSFADVAANDWFADAAAWAAAKGIVSVGADNLFKPEEVISREQFCVMLTNFLSAYGVTLPVNAAVAEYKDAATVSEWAASSVDFIKSLGLFQADENGNLLPQQAVKRSELALVMHRYYRAAAGENIFEAAPSAPASSAVQPVLLVTGKGLAALDATIANEKSYTVEDLKAMGLTAQQLYSAKNSSGTKSVFLAEGVSLDALLSALNYDGVAPIAVAASDGFVAKVDFTQDRYYYPNFVADSAEGAVKVGATIAWAVGGERGLTDIPAAATELSALRLLVGQLDLEDKNNSKFTDGVAKIEVGEALPAVITVAGTEYTRAQILMMPRTEGTYTYMTKGGEATAVVRGVMLSDLLTGYTGEDSISFTAADGYDMSAATCTLDKAVVGKYMLAYEKQDENGNWVGIFDKAKSGDAVGFFTLYVDGERPSSLINGVAVKKASGIDFSTSLFRHITNGGMPGSSPYNIDAITGSTLTVEGPGMTKSIPLSIRELENANAGTVRQAYTDVNGEFLYEGIDLYHVLYGMTTGDNGINTTKDAFKIILKNRNRQNIGEFTIAQIKEAHDNGRPIIVAYGVGLTDGSKCAPFVFDLGLGAVPELFNEDGCIKLVYDPSSITGDTNVGYDKFLSMAYIYVCEENTPGFKHDKAPYNDASLVNYILTFKGDGLGREVNLSVKEIEALVQYDADGKLVPGGLGHRDLYSLTNTTYWYVNEYEGIRLYPLLQYLGLNPEIAMDTKVTFTASDGYMSADSFTLAELADPNLFHYFEKGAEDLNDGTYVPKAEDLKGTGYPVLLCYGVNSYPYTITTSDGGYLSGLSNNGGPFRVIFGKRQYNHTNGSNQIQFVNNVVIGDESYHYSTHKYSDKAVYNALAEDKLTVTVKGDDGLMLKDNVVYTVGQLEDLIYGAVTKQAAKATQVKGYYEMDKGGELYSDLYEGIDLEYFLTKIIEIPGIKGTVTFTNAAGETMTLTIAELFTKGSNPQTGVEGLGATLAFAKNGVPLVFDKKAEGFEKSYQVADGISLTVQNAGGPLALLIPAAEGRNAQSMTNIVSVMVNLEADKYAHLKGDYAALANNTLTVSGEGTTLAAEKVFTVGELEGKQSLAITAVYSFLNKKGTVSEVRYRGLKLYDFLKSTDVGLRSNAESVIVTTTDGAEYTISVSELLKNDYINSVSGAANLSIMLAYGCSPAASADAETGLPLVVDSSSAGYNAEYGNDGGPLMLIIGQSDAADINKSKCMKNVASIKVTASALDSWKHNVSDIYNVHSDYVFTLEVTNSDKSDTVTKTFTVAELEAMDSLIIRDDYVWVNEHTHEGVMLWGLIMQEFGNVNGIDNPSAITAFAIDGFLKEMVAIWGLEEVENGIKDSATGNRKHIIIAYSQDGLPLVPSESVEGYSGLAGNAYGPLRTICHENQGACMKNLNKIVVTLNGTDKISYK